MILDKYLVGWNKVEPVILSSVATGMNILLLSSHGTGKSSFARFVADAFSEDGSKLKLSKYNMALENLISMVGIPDPTALKDGKLEYATHERSILKADIVLFDELTRATKEAQNMVLEMLEEKTVFGFPLKYKFLIATANDSSYKATYKLDSALLDRFFCVVPVPTTSSVDGGFGAEELKEMINLNMGKRSSQISESNKELVKAVKSIRKEYDALWNNKNVRENIVEFCARFFSMLLTGIKETTKGAAALNQVYIPPRIIGFQFPRAILAIAAYYKVIKEDPDYLQLGAIEAIKYALGTKLGLPLDQTGLLMRTNEQMKDLLSDISSKINRIKVEITTGPISSRVDTFVQEAELINEKFEIAEVINAVGNILQEIKIEKKQDVCHLAKLLKAMQEKKMSSVCVGKLKLAAIDAMTRHEQIPDSILW